ncbi:hypothetical protein BDV12DRAFT_203141 [Aspergillus spectabilis]
MKLSVSAILFGLLVHAIANPIRRANNTPYFITIGDSTVAVNGRWGDGFLSFVDEPASGTNRGKSGSTTVSWRANGRWAALVNNINETVADYDTIVTVQVGHNDQKSLTLDEYRENLVTLCTDIQALDYINAIGAANVETYDLSEGDGTHINTAGQTVFGRVVADLLLQKRIELEEYFIPNEELSEKIWSGEHATGDE